MEIQESPLPWDSEDRRILAEFFKSDTGLRLLPKLAEQIPPLLDGGETNAILIRNGVVKGVQLTMQEFLALARSEPKAPQPETAAYPPLTDDAQWNDGAKIET